MNQTKYINTLIKLNNINQFRTSKKSLESVLEISKYLDDPHRAFQTIHIAGTNGKGSVTYKLGQVLQNAGFKTGIFTSPHLFAYPQRITINNINIQQQYLIETLQRLFDISEKKQITLTFFQYLTLVSFLYFKDSQIDIATIEVGIGGKCDCTNIINPILSVITSIGLDHCEILGSTLSQVAEQQAGIIKPQVPAVIGLNATPKQIFIDIAQKNDSDLYFCLDNDNHSLQTTNANIQKLLNKKNRSITERAMLYNLTDDYLQQINSQLTFDEINNQTVKMSCEILQKYYPDLAQAIKNDHISDALKVRPKCRLQKFALSELLPSSNNKKISFVYFDVAHNPHALHYSLSSLVNQLGTDEKIRVIFGTSSQKDATESMQIILQQDRVSKLHLVCGDHFRSMKIDNLQSNILNLKTQVGSNKIEPLVERGSISHTLNYILQENNTNSEHKQRLLIIGSFFIMQESRIYFNIKEEYDPVDLNQKGLDQVFTNFPKEK